jgi:hypothetical protein
MREAIDEKPSFTTARMPYILLSLRRGMGEVKWIIPPTRKKTDTFSSCSSWDTGYGVRLQNTLSKIWEGLLLGHMLTRIAHTGLSEGYTTMKSVRICLKIKNIII